MDEDGWEELYDFLLTRLQAACQALMIKYGSEHASDVWEWGLEGIIRAVRRRYRELNDGR